MPHEPTDEQIDAMVHRLDTANQRLDRETVCWISYALRCLRRARALNARLRAQRQKLIDMCISPCSAGFEVSAGYALDDVRVVANRRDAEATVLWAAGIIDHA